MAIKGINSVYILGLGAIGGTYAAKLFDVDPELVTVIADNNRIVTLKQSGLTVNGKLYDFNLVSSDKKLPPADLIIIAVKYPHLLKAIEDIKSFVGTNTIVMSLLNGISSEETIGQEIGINHLLFSYVYMDAIREGASIRYTNLGKIVFGEKYNHVLTSRVIAVKSLFERAGIPYQIPQDMLRALWSKFMLNVGVNQTSALLRAPYGVFQQKDHAHELMLMAAKEVVVLSQAHGASLNEDDIDVFVDTINSLHPEGKTSMLQDVEAGRKTEVDIFAGAVIELGKKYNVPTPINDMLYRVIKLSEPN